MALDGLVKMAQLPTRVLVDNLGRDAVQEPGAVNAPRTHALGAELRKAREDTGLTQQVVADRLGRKPGVLSRWETGARRPDEATVEKILNVLGVDDERRVQIMALARAIDEPRWLATSVPDQRLQLDALLEIERAADRIVQVHPTLVPGFLQTDDYIRAIMTAGAVPAGEIATRVAVRRGRQQLLRESTSVSYVALVGEGALRQFVAGREAMTEQLRHLLAMSERPNVDLRVIPFTAGWSPVVEGPFMLLSGQPMTVVHVELRRSGLFLTDEDDVSPYRRAVDRVLRVALGPEETADRIRDQLSRLETP